MLRIAFAQNVPENLIGYQSYIDFWAESTGQVDKDTLKLPWPIADQSVSGLWINLDSEFFNKAEDWIQVFEEIYRVCKEGALVQIASKKATLLANADMPMNCSFFKEKMLFLSRDFRKRILDHYFALTHDRTPIPQEFMELKADFQQINYDLSFVPDFEKVIKSTDVISPRQAREIALQHPELVEHCVFSLVPCHDHSLQFTLVKVDKLGEFSMRIYPESAEQGSYISRYLQAFKIWESAESYLFLATLKYFLQQEPSKPVHIANIGANMGWYCLLGGMWDKCVLIDAFEPSPATLKILHQNIELYDLTEQVTIHECALSDKVGESSFFVDKNNDSASALVDNLPELAEKSPYHELATKIQTDTLDHIYLEKDESIWPKVVVIDVEGHEQHVFDGAQGLFDQGFRPIIFAEFTPYPLNIRGECTFYKDLMGKYHYKCYIIFRSKDYNHKTARLAEITLETLDQIYKLCVANKRGQYDLFLVPEHIRTLDIEPIV